MSKNFLRHQASILCASLLLSLWTLTAHSVAIASSEDDPSPQAPLHTVTYSVKEPASGAWILYFSEEVEEGYLARGVPDPMDPAGTYAQWFIGWYEDQGDFGEPVNLWRTPILADMNLYARFAGEADVPSLEGLHPKIHLTRQLNDDGTATIIAEITDVPPGVRYKTEWQNDLSGEFLPVCLEGDIAPSQEDEGTQANVQATHDPALEFSPDPSPEQMETENTLSITFPATEENLTCTWRLTLYF